VPNVAKGKNSTKIPKFHFAKFEKTNSTMHVNILPERIWSTDLKARATLQNLIINSGSKRIDESSATSILPLLQWHFMPSF